MVKNFSKHQTDSILQSAKKQKKPQKAVFFKNEIEFIN